jgi:C-terminal processing protease CtpA/Prc
VAFGCKTCTLDFTACSGYFGSTLCIDPQACNTCLIRQVPFLQSENTGIVPEQHSGKLLVWRVIDNSPAQRVGVHVGDEILSINGRSVGSFACNAGWSRDGQNSTLVLRRGAHEMQLQMSSVPLASLINSPEVVPSSTDFHGSFELDAPFTFGFRWKESGGHLVVSQVLLGSPAENAGLKTGDKIVSLNGVSLSTEVPTNISSLRDGDTPNVISFETEDGRGRKVFSLRSRGISAIITSPEGQNRVLQEQRALLSFLSGPPRSKK